MNFTSNFIYIALKKLTTPAAKLTPKQISLTSGNLVLTTGLKT